MFMNILQFINKLVIAYWHKALLVITIGAFVFWLLCVNSLPENHILIIKNRLTGEYRIEKRQKMYITGPWPLVVTGKITKMPFIIRMAPITTTRDNYSDVFFPPKLATIRSDFSEIQLWEYIGLIGDPTNSMTSSLENSQTLAIAIFSNNVPSFIEIKDPKTFLEKQ